MGSLPKLKSSLKTMQGLDSILDAMLLVSAVEVQKHKKDLALAQDYFGRLEKLADETGLTTPERPLNPKGKILLIMVVSNKGMCASFNTALYREVYKFYEQKSQEIELMVLGKKGLEFNTRGRRAEYIPVYSDLIGERIWTRFFEEWDEVYLAYNHYRSFVFQQPTVAKLLPYDRAGQAGEAQLNEYEPERPEYQLQLSARYFKSQLRKNVVESLLGETSTRMFTLKGATDKAEEHVGDLKIAINKERQALINRELAEISGTFEILREES